MGFGLAQHADGRGPPGVIIHYNCDDYDCEPDLIQKLTKIVRDHRANVYLAPGSYDGKITSFDSYEQHLTHLIRDRIGDSFAGNHINVEFLNQDGRTACVVRCKEYLPGENQSPAHLRDDLYRRVNNQSIKIEGAKKIGEFGLERQKISRESQRR